MKQNKKKTVKKNNAKKDAPLFDDLVEHEFYAKVFLGPSNTDKVEFSVKPLPEEDGHLTFDHVEDVAYEMIEKLYPEEYYPKATIDGFMFIKNDAGEWCPVVREGDNDGISLLKKSKEYNAFLILPEATYSLSPEYKLYIELVNGGMIDANKTPFDYDSMKKIVESISTKNTPKKKVAK